MAQKTQGLRNKTRQKLTKHVRDKDTISNHLKDFEEGDRVLISIDPSVHKGMPDPKFHGKTAEVQGKRGRSFVLTLQDLGKEKELQVYPAHLEEA
ncbi:MAG: 50S ribosomal protein L21e [Candidatus Nanohaloarchaea archaeon]|nr:50S ribosomal protein L21e [Candidatus Nanohaloarchaea archaeon]